MLGMVVEGVGEHVLGMVEDVLGMRMCWGW